MCLVVLLAIISPRLALVATWLFSGLLGRAFDEALVPLIGFFILPWTTLGYALMWAVGPNGVEGFEWLIVIVAFLADLSALAGSRAVDR
ncbi:MAG: hypothetical protein ACR2K6_08255 [Solirubrobacterales bacterium]